MADKIETLTEAQLARIPEIRNDWLARGLSTQPTDRAGSEEAVRRAYKAAALKEPKIVIWLASPLAGVYGADLFVQLAKMPSVRAQVWAQVWDQVGDQVWAQVGAQVWAQVWAQVRAQVGDQVRAQVGDQVWVQVGAQVRAQVGDQVRDQIMDQVGAQVIAQVRAQVRDQVGDQVWAQVGAQVGAQVSAQVRDQVWDQVGAQVSAQVRDQVSAQVRDQVSAQVWDQVGAQVWDQVGAQVSAQVRDQVSAQVRDQVSAQVSAQVSRCGYGLHDAGWLSFYDYLSRVIGLKDCDRLRPLMDMAERCGWWWPFAGAVVMTEKPVLLSRDDRGRLHNESGPAIAYSDGWGIHAIHGVRVPADVVEDPESITVERIEAEKNAEVRRVMVERYGRDRYVQDGGFTRLDSRIDELGKPQHLHHKSFADGREILLLETTNSSPEPDGTFKVYFMGIHPEVRPLHPEGLREPQERTCLNAVASLAGMTGEEYVLSIQT